MTPNPKAELKKKSRFQRRSNCHVVKSRPNITRREKTKVNQRWDLDIISRYNNVCHNVSSEVCLCPQDVWEYARYDARDR